MYLITQSLLSSWGYMYKCFDVQEEEAYNSFLSTLKREHKEPTKAMLSGLEFENEVYKVSHGKEREPHPKWEQGIQTVAAIIKGAPTQVRTQRGIEVCGIKFLLYGVLDAIKAGVIYDVKFSNKSFGSVELMGRYTDSPQHPAYMYMEQEAYKFEYLVSDGNDIYRESYDRKSTRPIAEIIEEFITSIKDMGFLDLYKEHWVAK